jgi:hypothetical protein
MIVSKEEVLKDVLIHHASCYGKQVLDTTHTHKSVHKSENGILEMLRKTGLWYAREKERKGEREREKERDYRF